MPFLKIVQRTFNSIAFLLIFLLPKNGLGYIASYELQLASDILHKYIVSVPFYGILPLVEKEISHARGSNGPELTTDDTAFLLTYLAEQIRESNSEQEKRKEESDSSSFYTAEYSNRTESAPPPSEAQDFPFFDEREMEPSCENLVKLMPKEQFGDTSKFDCNTVAIEDMGFYASKVFILKDKDGPRYALKVFRTNTKCLNESAKLKTLERELEISELITEDLSISKYVRRFLTVPEGLKFSQLLTEIEAKGHPCFLVLEAAKGVPVVHLSNDYLKNGGDLSIFSHLGRKIGEFHKKNSLYQEGELDAIQTAIHGDLHFNNVFFDQKNTVITFIDNSFFERNGNPLHDLNASLGVWETQSYRAIEKMRAEIELNHSPMEKMEARRSLELIKAFLNGYAENFNQSKYKLNSHSVKTELDNLFFNKLKNKYNQMVDDCIANLCYFWLFCNQCPEKL